MDTRLVEVIIGFLAVSYGTQAMQPGWSQFQTLLTLKAVSFEWGLSLAVLGTMSVIFSFSRFHLLRCFIHASLFLIWGAVVLLFAQYREAGQPLYNGIIFGVVSFAVIWTIIRHEKNVRSCS